MPKGRKSVSSSSNGTGDGGRERKDLFAAVPDFGDTMMDEAGAITIVAESPVSRKRTQLKRGSIVSESGLGSFSGSSTPNRRRSKSGSHSRGPTTSPPKRKKSLSRRSSRRSSSINVQQNGRSKAAVLRELDRKEQEYQKLLAARKPIKEWLPRQWPPLPADTISNIDQLIHALRGLIHVLPNDTQQQQQEEYVGGEDDFSGATSSGADDKEQLRSASSSSKVMKEEQHPPLVQSFVCFAIESLLVRIGARRTYKVSGAVPAGALGKLKMMEKNFPVRSIGTLCRRLIMEIAVTPLPPEVCKYPTIFERYDLDFGGMVVDDYVFPKEVWSEIKRRHFPKLAAIEEKIRADEEALNAAKLEASRKSFEDSNTASGGSRTLVGSTSSVAALGKSVSATTSSVAEPPQQLQTTSGDLTANITLTVEAPQPSTSQEEQEENNDQEEAPTATYGATDAVEDERHEDDESAEEEEEDVDTLSFDVLVQLCQALRSCPLERVVRAVHSITLDCTTLWLHEKTRTDGGANAHYSPPSSPTWATSGDLTRSQHTVDLSYPEGAPHAPKRLTPAIDVGFTKTALKRQLPQSEIGPVLGPMKQDRAPLKQVVHEGQTCAPGATVVFAASQNPFGATPSSRYAPWKKIVLGGGGQDTGDTTEVEHQQSYNDSGSTQQVEVSSASMRPPPSQKDLILAHAIKSRTKPGGKIRKQEPFTKESVRRTLTPDVLMKTTSSALGGSTISVSPLDGRAVTALEKTRRTVCYSPAPHRVAKVGLARKTFPIGDGASYKEHPPHTLFSNVAMESLVSYLDKTDPELAKSHPDTVDLQRDLHLRPESPLRAKMPKVSQKEIRKQREWTQGLWQVVVHALEEEVVARHGGLESISPLIPRRHVSENNEVGENTVEAVEEDEDPERRRKAITAATLAAINDPSHRRRVAAAALLLSDGTVDSENEEDYFDVTAANVGAEEIRNAYAEAMNADFRQEVLHCREKDLREREKLAEEDPMNPTTHPSAYDGIVGDDDARPVETLLLDMDTSRPVATRTPTPTNANLSGELRLKVDVVDIDGVTPLGSPPAALAISRSGSSVETFDTPRSDIHDKAHHHNHHHHHHKKAAANFDAHRKKVVLMRRQVAEHSKLQQQAESGEPDKPVDQTQLSMLSNTPSHHNETLRQALSIDEAKKIEDRVKQRELAESNGSLNASEIKVKRVRPGSGREGRLSVRMSALLALQNNIVRRPDEIIDSYWDRLQTQRFKISVLRGTDMSLEERSLWKQMWGDCYAAIAAAQSEMEEVYDISLSKLMKGMIHRPRSPMEQKRMMHSSSDLSSHHNGHPSRSTSPIDKTMAYGSSGAFDDDEIRELTEEDQRRLELHEAKLNEFSQRTLQRINLAHRKLLMRPSLSQAPILGRRRRPKPQHQFVSRQNMEGSFSGNSEPAVHSTEVLRPSQSFSTIKNGPKEGKIDPKRKARKSLFGTVNNSNAHFSPPSGSAEMMNKGHVTVLRFPKNAGKGGANGRTGTNASVGVGNQRLAPRRRLYGLIEEAATYEMPSENDDDYDELNSDDGEGQSTTGSLTHAAAKKKSLNETGTAAILAEIMALKNRSRTNMDSNNSISASGLMLSSSASKLQPRSSLAGGGGSGNNTSGLQRKLSSMSSSSVFTPGGIGKRKKTIAESSILSINSEASEKEGESSPPSEATGGKMKKLSGDASGTAVPPRMAQRKVVFEEEQ